MPRGQPKVHVEVIGSWKDKPMYERVNHWAPHIEAIYAALGYGKVTVTPTPEAIEEYENLHKQTGAA